ncbi:hypothetical protein [Lutibaculum baratangense]|uniref:Uncharacterized protein n=1 Tax=Lutibaculum baratangense AMV1 TaxID=631454 RepID=V4RL94_9HYPH|nr:hypothetical protein [Lutibaculum baratangense]ESR23995.1 hypothetical protein N177_2764 [Lutibaculum baratangense AMV1]
MGRRILIIHNPRAGLARPQRYKAVLKYLVQARASLEILQTTRHVSGDTTNCPPLTA